MRFLGVVERVGNKMPEPMTLFLVLGVLVLIIAHIGSMFGWGATGMMYNSTTGAVEEQTVMVTTLLTGEGITYILNNMVKLFVNYSALGITLVMFFGIAVADGSGYLALAIKRFIRVTPSKLIYPAIIFIGVCSNIVNATATLIMLPLSAMIFLGYKRHPIAGMMMAFAAINCGLTANVMLTNIDALIGGATQQAAQILDPSYTVPITANWYFMIASTFMMAIVGTFITRRVVEPMLGPYDPVAAGLDMKEIQALEAEETPLEKKAFRWANITLLVMIAALVAVCIPADSIMRNPTTGSLINGSLLMNQMVIFVAILFFVPSLVYGRIVGVFKTEKDVLNQIYKTFAGQVSFICVAFTAAQFLDWFSKTNLATVISLRGAEILSNLKVHWIPLLIIFIVFCAFINIFMFSATAKWFMFAPVFVPMLMTIGISPEMTQLAYRIGDSCTNAISPMSPYIPFIIMLMQKYKKDAGMGTHFSLLVPYAFGFLVAWIIFFVIYTLLGLPIGPGISYFY